MIKNFSSKKKICLSEIFWVKSIFLLINMDIKCEVESNIELLESTEDDQTIATHLKLQTKEEIWVWTVIIIILFL